ncbi:acetolactate synthase-1/2/3 large subunit [Scopulibacillus darangshiensis]|uniref:Acetolactate synthase-1/2/3 large subunit n=1 Tax=Scopulibacillus darangshiensis TaxID=442528 RepID=A0A4R2NZR4_9BACL|nr:thiamine pyrophosphate-binding protein [Scopulibacillus darangshiensis]TCP27829.1 acetolactate synthase-1/2/3 large subunit [Scopulibacillus darangshiensis]
MEVTENRQNNIKDDDIKEKQKMTGGTVIAKTLKNYGIPYVAGIPGHGCWMLTDALMEEGSEIPFIQVMHEQSAVHMADGYYRASGRPMAAITSVGPGATNTIIGLGTAYADSTATLLLTGAPATHMEGHGVMQELDRYHSNNFPRVTEPVTKRHWEVNRVEQLPFIMHRAFNAMLSGRPGPVHVEVPMDIQTEAADVAFHDLKKRMPVGKIRADSTAIDSAVHLLLTAKRPVIVAGGGVMTSEGTPELRQLAEAIGAAVVTTWNGKSAFPEDHHLFAGSVGQTGTTSGNYLAANADVVISVGCRFTDWSASSYRKGASFSFPPAKLIHIDIDPQEIGKNYPTEVGIVADAKLALQDMLALISREDIEEIEAKRKGYFSEINWQKEEWEKKIAPRRDSDDAPMTSQRPLAELRKILPRDGIVVVGSGNTQGAVKQTFPVYEPRTFITSGSFSSMGWAVPAAIGAKLAKPDRKVVCIVGDGDFMQTLPEIAVAVMHNIPVVFLVQNNMGYMSIRGGQRKITGRHIGTEFNLKNGEPYSPNFSEVANNFGLKSWRAETPEEVGEALKLALETDGPSLVEAMTARDAGGPFVPGWWDFPVPAYIEDERQDEYAEGRALEQHL